MQDKLDVTKRTLLTGALAVGAGAAALGTMTRDARAQLLESVSIQSQFWPRSKKAELLRWAMPNSPYGFTRMLKAVS